MITFLFFQLVLDSSHKMYLNIQQPILSIIKFSCSDWRYDNTVITYVSVKTKMIIFLFFLLASDDFKLYTCMSSAINFFSKVEQYHIWARAVINIGHCVHGTTLWIKSRGIVDPSFLVEMLPSRLRFKMKKSLDKMFGNVNTIFPLKMYLFNFANYFHKVFVYPCFRLDWRFVPTELWELIERT